MPKKKISHIKFTKFVLNHNNYRIEPPFFNKKWLLVFC